MRFPDESAKQTSMLLTFPGRFEKYLRFHFAELEKLTNIRENIATNAPIVENSIAILAISEIMTIFISLLKFATSLETFNKAKLKEYTNRFSIIRIHKITFTAIFKSTKKNVFAMIYRI